MTDAYYRDARRRGLRAVREAAAEGRAESLPVLEAILTQDQLRSGKFTGEEQLPLELIVGTMSGSRVQAFGPDFMPLLEENSEFAEKWSSICQAHLKEGIRDPIQVCEYMNRFYVTEGNKRVSVLKYFGAESVAARVTRILPEDDGSEKYRRYMAFLDFYRASGLRIMEFTDPDSYYQVLRELGKAEGQAEGECWSQDFRRDIDSLFYYFRRAFDSLGGGELNMTAGDVLLAYCKIVPPDKLWTMSPGQIRDSLAGVWEDIVVSQSENAVDVKLEPSEKKETFIEKILPARKLTFIKAGFVHDSSPRDLGWTYSHERGREQVQRILGDAVETVSYFRALDDDPLAVIEQAIADGCQVIFTTSARLYPASLTATAAHPEVTIFNCSLNKSHRYVRTYYARIYEVKFIAGAIAGAMSGGEPVGYICNYPIWGQFAGINAFALGVQMTNPYTQVYLDWVSVGGADAAMERLTDRGIHIISARDDVGGDLDGSGGRRGIRGLVRMADDSARVLAQPLWKWGRYYALILRQIMDRTLQEEYKKSGKALNYYFGLSAGAVGLRYGSDLPPGVIRLADILKDGMRRESLHPFRGPITAQSGYRIAGQRDVLSPDQILNMDWLNENVVGMVPEYEQMNEIGRSTVSIAGINPFRKDV